MARRRRVAGLACGALALLVLLSWLVPLGRLLGDENRVRTVDERALQIPPTPTDAPALSQLPEGLTLEDDEVLGVDVSAHQSELDWEAMRADGISFAYIKATEGSGFTDSRYAEHSRDARAAGLTIGAYHYFTLCSPGRDQARDFLRAAPPDDAMLPPALDLEFDGACEERPETERVQAEIDAFTLAVEAAWGRRVVVYSSSDWRRHYGLPVSDGRPDWLYDDDSRPVQDDWAVWQLRFDGRVAGSPRPLDMDVLRPAVLRDHARLSPEQRRDMEDALAREERAVGRAGRQMPSASR
ncbi:GH25 family lysozyme [Brachybacterium sillae]|uniref:GH25 family lysozyme n=1 Tax=Brachybacterium sillae TaxID=2810536 RepID=UPI00217CCDD2|nr:GH25 family lysozyme [Brachybacterium sillae]